LGNVYLYQRNFTEAEKYIRKALTIWENDNNPFTLITKAKEINNIANFYYSKRDFDAALPLFTICLNIYEKKFGISHSSLYPFLNNMGMTLKALSKFPEAVVYLKRALEITEKDNGFAHPDTIGTLTSIANLYSTINATDDLIPILQKLITAQEQKLGVNHPGVAITLNFLAQVYDAAGRYDDALNAYKRDFEIRDKYKIQDPNSYNASLQTLIQFCERVGKKEEIINMKLGTVNISV